MSTEESKAWRGPCYARQRPEARLKDEKTAVAYAVVIEFADQISESICAVSAFG